jgi:glycine/D-amino acid oxidase-like deaminating enzyme/nitrite reductase/ring-hydroxylating ferredoxin subunit
MPPPSLWLDTVPRPTFPKLDNNLSVDVAVIGGGIAGLMTAYFLSQQGKSVALIEARTMLSGTTGHTTAHLSIAHDLIYHYLIKTFDQALAHGYAKANQTAIHTLEKIIQTEKIDADFAWVDEYLYTPNGQDETPLQEEFAATQQLGLSTQLVAKTPLPFSTGKAIRYPHQARFHPVKFLSAIAQKLVDSGHYIFEHTRALDVVKTEPLKVITKQGEITANDVVIATMYPFLDRGFYFARQITYTSYVIAATLNYDFPDAMFDSTETHSHYLRRQPYPDGFVVIIGGEGHQTGTIEDTQQNYAALENYARSNLDIKSILYRWSTHDAYPHDGLPYIGKFLPNDKHLWVATGFQGWGMTNATVAGQLLTDLILERTNPWRDVFNPARFKITAELIKENANIGKMFAKSKLAFKPPLNTGSLKPDESKIMDQNGEKVAVYKDEKNHVHAVSAVCQHMGCNVGFNTAEKTWDCPCHGSRFTVDGKVLYGPTVHPLPQISSDKT